MILNRITAPALAILMLLLVTACGGDDTPAVDATLPPPTATPTPLPDADGDGFADAIDPCPDAAETVGGPDAAAPDGCPETLDEIVAAASDDLDDYWRTRLNNVLVPYTPPAALVPYSGTAESACGPVPPANAIYCGADQSVYYDADWLAASMADYGDFAPIFVLAHEWGHIVQADLGLLGAAGFYSIDIELGADCLAGVYARNAAQRDLLAVEDAQEAGSLLADIGDDASVAWNDPSAHGTTTQRVSAFTAGFEGGLDECGRVSDGTHE